MLSTPSFYGEFALIRSGLDYEYHQHYSKERQLQQDKWIKEYIGQLEPVCSKLEPPLLLYTAGAMGSGKSHSVRRLLNFDPNNTLIIDPDKFKEMIPEYRKLKREDPLNASSIVHQESGFLCEIALEVALERQLNVIVDGSLTDYQWHINQFAKIRKMYPKYTNIEIMFVRTIWIEVLRRATERGEITGRIISPGKLRDTYNLVTKSVEILQLYANKVYYVDNNESPFITKVVVRSLINMPKHIYQED